MEHPFGTMKRQWGFDHIMTKKSMERAAADVGFIFIAYNLKRIMNIIGIAKLIDILTRIIVKNHPKTLLKALFSILKNLKQKIVYSKNNCIFRNVTINLSYL